MGGAQPLFHHLAHAGSGRRAMNTQAIGYVISDGQREWIGALKHHANSATKPGKVHARSVYIHPIEKYAALDAHIPYKLVHPVKTTQKGRLAASGRADNGRDGLRLDLDVDMLQRVELSVVQI